MFGLDAALRLMSQRRTLRPFPTAEPTSTIQISDVCSLSSVVRLQAKKLDLNISKIGAFLGQDFTIYHPRGRSPDALPDFNASLI